MMFRGQATRSTQVGGGARVYERVCAYGDVCSGRLDLTCLAFLVLLRAKVETEDILIES